jgi:nucleoid DNA-binding protein
VTITYENFIRKISKESGITMNDIAYVLKYFIKVLVETVKTGDRVKITDFGIFSRRMTHYPVKKMLKVDKPGISYRLFFKESLGVKEYFNDRTDTIDEVIQSDQ